MRAYNFINRNKENRKCEDKSKYRQLAHRRKNKKGNEYRSIYNTVWVYEKYEKNERLNYHWARNSWVQQSAHFIQIQVRTINTMEQANDESTSTFTSLFSFRRCCSSVGLSEEPEGRWKPDPCLGRTRLCDAVVDCPTESWRSRNKCRLNAFVNFNKIIIYVLSLKEVNVKFIPCSCRVCCWYRTCIRHYKAHFALCKDIHEYCFLCVLWYTRFYIYRTLL